jgi:hypothetical protein
MTHRTYTPDEIDRMRVAVQMDMTRGLLFSTHEGGRWEVPPPEGYTGEYLPQLVATRVEMIAMVEDRLRTYVAASISPEALKANAKGEK